MCNEDALKNFEPTLYLFNLLITHFRPMFHLRINQVIGFYKQNVTLPQVFFKVLQVFFC